jgi:hypothetical protein
LLHGVDTKVFLYLSFFVRPSLISKAKVDRKLLI